MNKVQNCNNMLTAEQVNFDMANKGKILCCETIKKTAKIINDTFFLLLYWTRI